MEIVIIALGTVIDQNATVQIVTVSAVSLVATVGLYGLVALLVRMDDAGHQLIERSKKQGVLSTLGHLLVGALPITIWLLSVMDMVALL